MSAEPKPVLSTVTVAECGLGNQAWKGVGVPNSGFVRCAWPTQPAEKPDQAFFTSTWDVERRTSAWIEFPTQWPHRQGEQIWLLEPDPSAHLVIIDAEDIANRLRWASAKVTKNERKAPEAAAVNEGEPAF